MKDTIYNFSTSVKIEDTRKGTICRDAEHWWFNTINGVSWKQQFLMQTGANIGPSHWYQQTTTLSGKRHSFKVPEAYARIYVPKDSSLILIRIPLLLLFPSLRPLNEQESLSCSLPHQGYKINIRGSSRKIEIGQKKYDIVKEKGNHQKNGETSAQESSWGKKNS